MSVKKVTETTSSKILNSDIYDITKFVDEIKKKNIDGVDSSKETLLIGMYGYLGYQFASLLQNAIVTSSELSNEAIPTRAKFDRNVITHALSLGVKKVSATAANMKVLLMFPEKALRANMVNGKFIFRKDTPLNFDEFEFHTDYDIEISYVNLTDSTNGKEINYVYTAKYIMDDINPISTIENAFLPPISVFNYIQDNMVVLTTNLHQVYYQTIEEKILSSDVIANKTISFSFENQMSHFMIKVKEPSSSSTGEGKTVSLTPVYDGLYNQEIAEKKYCYYQYINSNTIRIRFDPTNYQPPANSDIIIELYTTAGAAGNFEYSTDNTVTLTSNNYTNLYCIIAQRGDDGSCGGLDRQTVEELQHIIPKEALSRGSITTNTDLSNYFNSLNNENSVLHVFRKEDNILDRIYYVYNLMKDSERNVVPTNTIPIYIESTRRDNWNGNIYIESGTPIFLYKFGKGADINMIRDNYIGYLEEKISDTLDSFEFYNGSGMSTYQGTPSTELLEEWTEICPHSFDQEKDIEDYDDKMIEKKPSTTYDFFEDASICFKIYHNDIINPNMHPNGADDSYLYDKYYYGNCRSCSLSNYSMDIGFIKMLVNNQITHPDPTSGLIVVDFEFEFTDGSITVHFPERQSDTEGLINNYVTLSDNGTLLSIDEEHLSAIRYFRPFHSIDGVVTDVADYCEFPLVLKTVENDNTTELRAVFYYWTTDISFYDETGSKFSVGHYTSKNVLRKFWVPDYITKLSGLDMENRKNYVDKTFNNIFNPYIFGDASLLVLESINTLNVYSYDGQSSEDGTGEYSFDSLSLAEADLIRYEVYNNYGGEHPENYVYTNPNTWPLGEVLSIEKNNGRIVSIEILTKNEKAGEFQTFRYRLPRVGDTLDDGCIVTIYKISKFLYTTPLSIVLKDDPTVNTHRITASYYLDIINETRYQEFEHINSKSPIQFIMSSIKTQRSSYLSDNRYKYNIGISIMPNTGNIDNDMINNTQVIAVFYKRFSKDSTLSKPIMYSIAKFEGTENGTMNYNVTLYSKPFATSDKNDTDDDRNVIDKQNDLYFGSKQFLKELNEKYPRDYESVKTEFFDEYCMFEANANIERPVEMPDNFDPANLPTGYIKCVYLNLNTELKIYILHKYDTINTSIYTDGATREYLAVSNTNADALYNTISPNTQFIPIIESDTEGYILKDMVLTNVYNTHQGINLLYDYSNIMNSFITSIKTNDIFNPDQSGDKIESYIVNRVPCVRYFYWNTEERVLSFIKDMKAKINYVLDAIDPLETTFGLDYKFFNTYGPSNMYRLTDDDGDVTDLIDNVALTITFRAKFYNEDTDAASMIDPIKNTIKDYLENLDQLDDIHFPNVTTLIESQYSEYLIYFEFVSFNIYNATTQHIISVEDQDMLSMVPEFLHVDTNDWNGKPYINIRIVTG
jgi:hypothetical protein